MRLPSGIGAGWMLAAAGALAADPVPKGGFVPSETVAVAIAEAVLAPIYGREEVAYERPLHAVLRGDVWIVTGNTPPFDPAHVHSGGPMEIRIARTTGQIIQVDMPK